VPQRTRSPVRGSDWSISPMPTSGTLQNFLSCRVHTAYRQWRSPAKLECVDI